MLRGGYIKRRTRKQRDCARKERKRKGKSKIEVEREKNV
jgi:hypothetical protein